jgi:hypothetical protein
MDDKIAKELIKQLSRIADALEKSNMNDAATEKRRIKLEKLEERNLRADLREKLNPDFNPSKVTPKLENE